MSGLKTFARRYAVKLQDEPTRFDLGRGKMWLGNGLSGGVPCLTLEHRRDGNPSMIGEVKDMPKRPTCVPPDAVVVRVHSLAGLDALQDRLDELRVMLQEREADR